MTEEQTSMLCFCSNKLSSVCVRPNLSEVKHQTFDVTSMTSAGPVCSTPSLKTFTPVFKQAGVSKEDRKGRMSSILTVSYSERSSDPLRERKSPEGVELGAWNRQPM
jgi:hypothetical protein